uniref:Putative secreted protein n=1 Tax=Panstrongylus lignarius TaxID=156445 RepID=A0A224Y291_9HEMI
MHHIFLPIFLRVFCSYSISLKLQHPYMGLYLLLLRRNAVDHQGYTLAFLDEEYASISQFLRNVCLFVDHNSSNQFEFPQFPQNSFFSSVNW